MSVPTSHGHAQYLGRLFGMALIALCSDELSLEAEASLACRLIEDGEDPSGWTVRFLWASDADRPVYAVVLGDGEGRCRAFTVVPDDAGYDVIEVTEG